MEAPDMLKDVQNYYNEIDRPHTRISLLTSTAKSPTGKLLMAASNSFLFDEPHGSEPSVIHEMWDNSIHLLKFRKKLQAGATYHAMPEYAVQPRGIHENGLIVIGAPAYDRFLARILQFQFYRSMCQASGHKGPLHECNFYGSKEAGAKLWKMLSYGGSKPWPEALEAMTGTREMDASALVEYFAPLQSWLEEQNKGRQCGW